MKFKPTEQNSSTRKADFQKRVVLIKHKIFNVFGRCKKCKNEYLIFQRKIYNIIFQPSKTLFRETNPQIIYKFG